jgi:alpha-mannosidase
MRPEPDHSPHSHLRWVPLSRIQTPYSLGRGTQASQTVDPDDVPIVRRLLRSPGRCHSPAKETALGIVNSGQYGFDLNDGEVRLSVLRSPLYCHERTFDLGTPRYRKHMDQGVHEIRVVLIPGEYPTVRNAVAGLADWLSTPPYALAHFPIGEETPSQREVMTLDPANIRLIAFKRSWDANSLVVRFQEIAGEATPATVHLPHPKLTARLNFSPYEIKTVRFERDGKWNEVTMIEEWVL